MRTAPALALLGFLLATAGCGSPTAPPRVTFPASPPPPERLLVRLDGVFYAPGSVIELSPGNPIEIEVLVYPNTSFPLEGPTPNWAGFVVETDAPAERLLIRRSIAWREVYEREDPETGDPTQVGVAVGIIRLEALESGETTDPGEVHEVRIGAPAGGFPGPPDIEVDTTPLRFRMVAPSPAISCDELTLTAEPDHRSGEPGGFFPASVRGRRGVQFRKIHAPGARLRGRAASCRSLPVPGWRVNSLWQNPRGVRPAIHPG